MRNRLHVLRAERRWTQADLASKAGVSRQTIVSIEREKYDPSLPLAFTLAQLFGVTIQDIFFPDSEAQEFPGTGSTAGEVRSSSSPDR